MREDEEKEFDEETCLTMEEWKEILDDDKEKDEREREDDRKEKGPHRDAFVREMIEELEIACEEEGNEEACEEFEAMMVHIEEIEEKEGGCDKERDDEEDESDEEEDWDEEDESEEDSDEDNSEE